MAVPNYTKDPMDITPPAKSSIVKVAGLWDLGWNTPIKEVDLWEYPLRSFAVERWYMAPVTGIRGPELLTEVPELSELIEVHRQQQVPIVFVDERGETPLVSFQHPTQALYVFGKAGLSPLAAYGRAGERSVVIEECGPAKGLLWPHQALSILLYHRQKQLWL